jgi:hypothetical protein
MVSPTNLRSELCLCSLDPGHSFWSAFAELIRDQLSPTDFCNERFFDVRATKPILPALDPRRDGDLDLLPFLKHLTPSPCEAVKCGEPRYVRRTDPSVGSSRLPELAQP